MPTPLTSEQQKAVLKARRDGLSIKSIAKSLKVSDHRVAAFLKDSATKAKPVPTHAKPNKPNKPNKRASHHNADILPVRAIETTIVRISDADLCTAVLEKILKLLQFLDAALSNKDGNGKPKPSKK